MYYIPVHRIFGTYGAKKQLSRRVPSEFFTWGIFGVQCPKKIARENGNQEGFSKALFKRVLGDFCCKSVLFTINIVPFL